MTRWRSADAPQWSKPSPTSCDASDALTDDERRALEALHPLREFLSAKDLQRLTFMCWRLQQGDK